MEYRDGETSPRAFLFKAGRMIDLNGLFGSDANTRLEDAVAINRHGQIVVNGRHNRLPAAWLLTPL